MSDKIKPKKNWAGWISLVLLIILFSGIFRKSTGAIAALDFANLTGSFGSIYEGINFVGKGGIGARAGFLFTLTLIPTVCLAVGLIDVVEYLGAMKAAEKLFNPLLRPMLGIPGIAGISFVATFTSSDIGAFMTKELVEKNQMTDDERTAYVAYQYSGSAVILNTINTQAPLLPIAVLAVGPIILIEMVCKIFGANMVRLIIKAKNKKEGVKIERAS